MELEHEQAKATWNQLIENGDVMGKEMPVQSSTTDRKPWKKKVYRLRLLDGSQQNPNKFFRDAKSLDEKYGERPKGIPYWIDPEKNERVYADRPEEKEQYEFKWEVVEGEKKGDWCWTKFVPHYFTADGKGKRAKIIKALDPDYDLTQGISDDHAEFVGMVCDALIEPREEGKYGNTVDFIPLDEDERAAYNLVGEGGEVDDTPIEWEGKKKNDDEPPF